MQPYDYNEKPIGNVELFNEERLNQLLEQKNVAEVRVFKLKKGMILSINDTQYKVSTVRPNGKITLRPIQ